VKPAVQPAIQKIKSAAERAPLRPEVLQRIKPQAVAAAGAKVEIPVGKSPFKGSADALVTIVEFSDFQCPFCKRVTGSLKQITDTFGDKVRIVFKHNPLPFHKDAPLAAQATFAAQQQGKFWEMHDKIFENIRAIKRDNLIAHAKTLGLDVARFEADMDSEAAKAQVKADQALAAKLAARGTPHFFVNGKRLPGALPFERFKSAIEAEITAVEGLVKSGKTLAEAYQLRVKTNYAAPAPRQKRPAADDKTVYNIAPGTSYGKGGSEPLVTIIEFSEFQCPFCSRVLPTIKQILDTYGDDVRVVFKHNPLSFHKDATPASKAALAAGEQGKFWEMHDLLFANQRKLKAADLEGYAAQLGLDMAKFKADMASDKFDAVIKADQALGARFGARGTPNFFVNGRNLRGAQPFASFKKLIDEELAKARALVAKGTPRAQVYAALTGKGKTKAEAPKRRQPAEDKKIYTVEVKPGDAIKGNPNAPVTIVEFSDFQCPFCSRVNPTLKKILDTYGDKVRVVFKHNPLSFHKDAPLASEAALAAGAQGKFWEMHDALFANQRKLKRADLEGYAAQIGLNLE
jgi:protein-disulfide isomerase